MNYYLDTNICVFFLRGKNPNLLPALLSHDPKTIKIPAVVAAELFYGAFKSASPERNMRQVRSFLSAFEIIPFEAVDAVMYGEIRADLERYGSSIGPNDLLIAASALSRNGILVTNNTREFSRVEKLMLEDWTL